jgi:hypothetical protein
MIVSAVHPWLMSLREDILKAKTIALGYPLSLPTEFMVMTNRPDRLMIEDKEGWIQRMGGGSKPNTVPASILNRLRRDR